MVEGGKNNMKKVTLRISLVLSLMMMVQVVLFSTEADAAPRWNLSRWMEEQYNSGRIKNKSLNDVALPGSHDTLTYDLDKSTWDQVDNGLLQSIGLVQDIVYNYARTQEASLYTQMSEGIRYFDFRLKKDKNGNIRGYHGMYGSKFDDYLFKEVARFVQNNPNEILILDFQDLHNLTDSDVQYVDQQMDKYLNGKLAERYRFSPSSTVKSFIESSARVIVLTNNNWWINKSNNVWRRSSSIVSNWENTADINTLVGHLNGDLGNKRSYKFYVSQMVLSVNKDEIIDRIKDAAKKLPIPIYGQYYFAKELADLANNSLYKFNQENNSTLESWVAGAPEGSVNIAMRDFYTRNYVLNTINRN